MARSIILALAAFLLLAACSPQEPDIAVDEQVPADVRDDDDDGDGEESDGEPADADDTITVQAIDLGFEGQPESLEAGTYEFVLDNTGDLEHDLVVEELGDREIARALGGETDSGVVELEEGAYTFYCGIPGHRAQMEFTIEVGG